MVFRFRHRKLLLWSLSLLAALVLAGCFSFAEDVTPPPGWKPSPIPPTPNWMEMLPDAPLDVARGEVLYQQRCASCHGPQGLGDGELRNQLTVPPAALGDPQRQWDAVPLEWFKVVTQGRLERQMPPFTSLTPEERWVILGYLFTLPLGPEQEAEARALYQATCASCHGPQGRGDGPEAAGTVPDLTDPQVWALRSLAQWDEAMAQSEVHAFEDALSPEQRALVLRYLRVLAMTAAAEAPPTATPTATPEAPTATPTSPPVTGTPATPPPEGALTATPVATETEAPATATATPTLTQTPGEGTATPGEPFLITIRGKVTHGGGEALPPDLPVRLQAFDDFTPVFTLETTTDADGAFVFPEVEAKPHRMYMVTVEYQGVTYLAQDVVVAFENTTEYEASITVYETTTDPSQVVVERLHLFVEIPAQNLLRMVELYVFNNRGDKTLVAPEGQPGVLEFTLPEGATNLRFPQEMGQLGQRFLPTETGFVDTVPILPGQSRLLFSYELPYDGKAEVRHPVPLQVEASILFLPPGLQVTDEAWVPAGTQDIEGMQFQIYQGPVLEAWDVLEVRLKGRPTTGGVGLPWESLPGWVLPAVLVGLGVLLVGAGLWYWRREDTGAGPEVPKEAGHPPVFRVKDIPPALRDDPEALMEAILALDDLYEAGEIDEELYRARRTAYKARLAQLLQKKK